MVKMLLCVVVFYFNLISKLIALGLLLDTYSTIHMILEMCAPVYYSYFREAHVTLQYT
jgi:hypothetical protein